MGAQLILLTAVPVSLKDAFNLDINNLECLHQGESREGREKGQECVCDSTGQGVVGPGA